MTTTAVSSAVVSSATPVTSRAVQNTFHLVVVASQRAKQLIAGSRPRLDVGQHRHTRVAVLEVNAGLVSWSLTEKPRTVPEADEPPTRGR